MNLVLGLKRTEKVQGKENSCSKPKKINIKLSSGEEKCGVKTELNLVAYQATI